MFLCRLSPAYKTHLTCCCQKDYHWTLRAAAVFHLAGDKRPHLMFLITSWWFSGFIQSDLCFLCFLCSEEKNGGTIKVADYIDAAKRGWTAPSGCRSSELHFTLLWLLCTDCWCIMQQSAVLNTNKTLFWFWLVQLVLASAPRTLINWCVFPSSLQRPDRQFSAESIPLSGPGLHLSPAAGAWISPTETVQGEEHHRILARTLTRPTPGLQTSDGPVRSLTAHSLLQLRLR